MKKIILSLVFIFITAACERVATKDGTIPAEYMSVAELYRGNYSGHLEGVNGTLTLTLEGNRPVLKFVGSNGNSDILGGNCEAIIGQLVAITPEKKDSQLRVDAAEFAFSGNKCRILGDAIFLDFKHNGTKPTEAQVNILHRYETEWRTTCYPQPQGGSVCRREPETFPVYLYGKFSRL